MIERDLADFVLKQHRNLLRNCFLSCSEAVVNKISFTLPGGGLRKDYRISVTAPEFYGKIQVLLGPGSGLIQIETSGPAMIDIRMWRNSSLVIEKGTTINSARIVCDDADIKIGNDGLWSDEIIVQSNDQHGIIDLATEELINGGRRSINIESHVWIGRRTIIMPDVTIGKGSLLAAGSLLTRNMPPNTIFAGVPAKQIRSNVTWSRATYGLNESERAILNLG